MQYFSNLIICALSFLPQKYPIPIDILIFVIILKVFFTLVQLLIKPKNYRI
jgi:hypothetical protein